MNVNVYLPDDLGKQAKDAELPFSQLLREAVEDELRRRTTVSATLAEPEQHIVTIEHPDGYEYEGRITGRCLYEDDRDSYSVYLTTDERLLAYDERRRRVDEVTLDELQADEDPGAYIGVAVALGVKPIIDL
jgi:hypothetical protein